MRTLKAAAILGAVSTALALLLLAAGIAPLLDATAYKFSGIPADGRPIPSPAWLTMLVFAFGTAFVMVDTSRPALRLLFAAVSVALLCSWTFVLSLHGKFFPPALPLLGTILSFALGTLWLKTKYGSRKQTLERLFGQRLPRAPLDALIASPSPAEFPGKVVNASVLVVAVQNHAELMELLPPEAYTAITNLYLRTASDYLVESGGYLDECNGECIRVVFGAPLPDERHAVRACRAAIDLAARLDELNKECDSKWQRRLDVRMAIDSGDIIAGVFGGTRLGSYSVAGPAVDFARRLCSASSIYGSRILIGPDTYTPAAESIEVRPIEILKVAARRRRVEIYEILAAKHGLSPERERSRDHFWTGVLHFRDRQWDKAVDEFTKARISGIPDEALDFYLRRIEENRRQRTPLYLEAVPALFQIA
jgi:class 3 adenylate cyclase